MHYYRTIMSLSIKHYVMLFSLVMLLIVASSAGAQTSEGTAEPPTESTQFEPVPTESVPAVTVPTDPVPLPTVPTSEEPLPIDSPPVVPVEPEEPVVTEPEVQVPQEPIAPQPAVTEPVAAPAPTEIAPTAAVVPTEESTAQIIEPTATTEPTIVPDATIEPTATAAPTATDVATPTVAPSPTPTPVVISWSQPESVSCADLTGSAQSLTLGDSATWRCQATIASDLNGDAPADLHILWQISASYSGDDVLLSLPEGAPATVHQPDPIPGGSNEFVTYRTNWSDGQALTFDVTVTRSSCAVGESPLALSAGVEVKTADNAVQIIHSGENPAATYLTSVAAPNPDVPVLTLQPISFGPIEWTGESWGTGQAIAIIEVRNDGCMTSTAHDIQVDVLVNDPGMQPVIANATAVSGDLYAVPPGTSGQTSATVAHIPAGFYGDGQVTVTFDLAPQPDVLPGGYSLRFEVTVVEAP